MSFPAGRGNQPGVRQKRVGVAADVVNLVEWESRTELPICATFQLPWPSSCLIILARTFFMEDTMHVRLLASLVVASLFLALSLTEGGDKSSGLVIDKAKRTVTIPCKIAPRKLANLDKTYPLEVVACWPAPKGQKAHETVVVFDVKPSEVHKALESLGLKAGKPALGQNGIAAGPEVKILLEIGDAGGKTTQVPIEQTMIDTKSNTPLAKQKWLFTGSALKYPDPEKDDKAYGADISGTLITIFPVTDDTVFQSTLGSKDEGKWRLETNSSVVPPIGTAVKLVIQAKAQ